MNEKKNKICAIICEYNPFHNGHKYQIEQIKKHGYKVVCIMSGNFTQRAEPAIFDKYARAQMAIENGADMVVQLPTIFATACAEQFAFGAVNILKSLSVDALSFGMENPDIETLHEIAAIQSSKEYSSLLKTNLSSGLSYAKACSIALSTISKSNEKEITEFISKPNNTLALEYVKAIKKLKLTWEIIPIKREGNYNDTELDGYYASASAIRRAINENDSRFKSYMPNFNEKLLASTPNMQAWDNIALFELRNATVSALKNLPSGGEGLENKLIKNAKECISLFHCEEKTKSKRYTFSRIRRLVLEYVLGISKENFLVPCEKTVLLAVKKDFKPMLKNYSPCVLATAKDLKRMPANIVEIEERAEKIYSLLTATPYCGIVSKVITD